MIASTKANFTVGGVSFVPSFEAFSKYWNNVV
jgi:hypothetical protein